MKKSIILVPILVLAAACGGGGGGGFRSGGTPYIDIVPAQQLYELDRILVTNDGIIDSSGRQVFFGKYIDLAGNFKGILRGTYGSMSMGPFLETAGWFIGEWIDENRIARGRLRGHWVAGQNSPGGFFHGEWGGHCQRGTDGGD